MKVKVPKIEIEEDPAVKIARRELKKNYDERERKKKVHRRRCKKCNQLFYKEQLADELCPECRRESPLMVITSTGRKKECFFCDNDTFNIFSGGVMKCVLCGHEYRMKNGGI